MLGLAQLAARLAESRVDRVDGVIISDNGVMCVNPRNYSYPWCAPCSAEYYKILDRIARGEKP